MLDNRYDNWDQKCPCLILRHFNLVDEDGCCVPCGRYLSEEKITESKCNCDGGATHKDKEGFDVCSQCGKRLVGLAG